MHTTPFDFVSALSAEELCPVCQELHAAVDECLCGSCQQHVCSDCSSLQPDTSWICAPCAALVPPRAYPISTARPTWAYLQEARHALREQTALWAREFGPAVARMVAFFRAALLTAIAWSKPRLHDLTVRSRADAARTLHRLGTAREVASYRLKRAVGSSLVFVRELPVREHATSLLIATMILIAVARAENGTDAS